MFKGGCSLLSSAELALITAAMIPGSIRKIMATATRRPGILRALATHAGLLQFQSCNMNITGRLVSAWTNSPRSPTPNPSLQLSTKPSRGSPSRGHPTAHRPTAEMGSMTIPGGQRPARSVASLGMRGRYATCCRALE